MIGALADSIIFSQSDVIDSILIHNLPGILHRIANELLHILFDLCEASIDTPAYLDNVLNYFTFRFLLAEFPRRNCHLFQMLRACIVRQSSIDGLVNWTSAALPKRMPRYVHVLVLNVAQVERGWWHERRPCRARVEVTVVPTQRINQ